MILLFLSSLLSLSLAVDRNNFKTCDQSGFCKRLRGMEKDKSQYMVDKDSVKLVNSSSVTFDIKHEVNSNVHTAVLRTLKDNSVRITVQEKEPVRPRYSPVDSFGDEPLQDLECKLSSTDKGSTVMFGGNKVEVTYEPFHLEVYVGNNVVASLNARGLFEIETQQLAPKAEEPAAEKPAEEENKESSEDLGLSPEEIVKMDWEESFRSHTDTNPRGPRALSMDITFTGFDKVYGIPEHADTLALKGTSGGDPYRLYNLDVFEYELDNPMALYGSIPFMYALSPEQSIGLMWLNAAETWVDVDYSTDKSLVGRVLSSVFSSDEIPRVDTHWMSESGLMDIVIFLGPKPADVMSQYSKVFGASYLPPMFAISYHQCRWNYNDQQDVKNVDAGFDKHDIPYDVLWLDIEHTDGKRYFTWDSRKFPDSKGMIDGLAKKGRKMVTIIDPHIKADQGYNVFKEGKDSPSCDVFVKNRDGNRFEGHCWPGASSWIDYSSPCARDFWADQFSYEKYQGSTPDLFTWNDMNEPSVFNGPEVTMHKDNLHGEDWEHRDVHNLYGHYMHRATHEAQVKRSGGESRAFVLSRAFFVGSHRYGPIWTGDNAANWEHLRISLPMLMSLNIAGYPFVGADVGGFFGNPNAELLTRWYQTGIFTPFFRAHAHLDTRRREPWLFGEETTALLRSAISIRYQLLPYLYTAFYRSSVDNQPLMRPLWFEFPEDKSLYSNERSFIVGDSLLIAPILEPGVTSHEVKLPGGSDEVWYNFFTHVVHSAGDMSIPVLISTIPAYIRGGSIIPLKMRLRRSSTITADDPYTLYIACDGQGKAKGSFYVDDGKSFDYKKGQFTLKELSFDGVSLTSKGVGTYSAPTVERIVFIGVKSAPAAVQVGVVQPHFSFDKRTNRVTVKKPGVKMSDDWTVTLVN